MEGSVTVPLVHTHVDDAGVFSHPETSDGLAELLAALQAELAADALRATA